MSKKKDLHLKISKKMYSTIKDNADVQDLNKSEYIRQLIASDNNSTLENKIDSIEYKIGEVQSTIENMDKKIPDKYWLFN